MTTDIVPRNRGATDLLKKLKAAQGRNANARARTGKPSSGTLTSPERISSAKKTPVRKVQLPALRKPTDPAIIRRSTTAITEFRKPSTAITEFRKPSTSVAKLEGGSRALARPAMEAVESGVGTIAKRAFGLLGGPAIELAAMTEPTNKGEPEWIADKKNRGPLMKGNASQKLSSGPRDDRASSGGTPYKPSAPAKPSAPNVPKITPTPFSEKRQGIVAKPKRSTLATDKSRLNKGATPAKKSLGRMPMSTGGTQMNVPAGPRGYNVPTGGVRTGAKTGTSAGADRKFKFKDIFK